MKTNEIIKKLSLAPTSEEIKEIKSKVKLFSKSLDNCIRKNRIKADIFVGGSVAKQTFLKKDVYEVDLFIRFSESENISDILEKIVSKVSKEIKKTYEKIHGSRDYFRIEDGKILFELIPVVKIKNPKDANNITDLSYFHVNYVNKNLNRNIINEILISKAFLKSAGVYGAESYIQGFSGYAIECLLIYYKTFEKMVKDFLKNDKIIIDIKKFYKNKDEIMILLNESKTRSPVVLVDPTWKERNVLAALSNESFDKLKEAFRVYIKSKSLSNFEEKIIDSEEIKKKAIKIGSEIAIIDVRTSKQPGDIAGTKMKKFYRFLISEISKSFNISESHFIYDQENGSKIILVAKSKGYLIRQGPPLSMEDQVKLFKANNEETFIKSGKIYSKTKVESSLNSFLRSWAKKFSRKVKEMSITEIKIK